MQVSMNPSSTNSSSTPLRTSTDKTGASGSATSEQNSGPRPNLAVDTWEPSGLAAEASSKDKKTDSSGLGFDMETFKLETKRQLLEQVQKSKDELAKAGIRIRWSSDIPYQVDPQEKAAEVPEEWGADKTSQRIVDFALSMRQSGRAKDLSDEEFIKQVRSSIEEGFRSAKSELKDLPGPSAKLFNDTYEAAMKKLDQTLEDWKNAKGSATPSTDPSKSSNAPEPTKAPVSAPISSFSVVA